MIYNDMPVIIPLLATGYLLTIYLLLILAQRTTKSSRYAANSLTDAYAPYSQVKSISQTDASERRPLRELPAASQPQKVQKVSGLH
jgi:hypothetical protein